MKNLTQIIENVLHEDGLPSSMETQNRKLSDIKHPTDQSRRHTFRGARIGGMKSDGSLGKVSRLRKDRTAAYKLSHPTLNASITTPARKVISPIKARSLLDPKAQNNINKAMQEGKRKTWQISNSNTSVTFEPGIGPKGTFFLVNKK